MKKQAQSDQSLRPTKKQHQTLAFISGFIAEHGYSPSYREIMSGCNYSSVATVALHVSNLIKRGHIVKRDKSARSLEVVGAASPTEDKPKSSKHDLVKQIEDRFAQLEKEFAQELLDEVYVLVGALKILGHHEPARAYTTQIAAYR